MADDGVAAAVVLAVLGREDAPTEAEYVRSYTGALLLVRALRGIDAIVKAIPREG
jgi:hypothetical protein